MNAKKQREKDRRRANKLAGEAWEAAEDGRFDLALKIIRRAVDLNPANPVLWRDQGTLLVCLHVDTKRADSMRCIKTFAVKCSFPCSLWWCLARVAILRRTTPAHSRAANSCFAISSLSASRLTAVRYRRDSVMPCCSAPAHGSYASAAYMACSRSSTA